uniref:Protein RALF-like 32 n=2 Tax=Opuntia streptacantha TaxID=393608 RepID=A0A7C8YQL3_OPUST
MEHLLICLALICLLVQGHSTLAKVNDSDSHCNGTIAECQAENEVLMPSEIVRRFLEERKYISIGALSRDQPACSGGPRGQAYSRNGDCLPPEANPYHRPCSKYYRCRSDS